MSLPKTFTAGERLFAADLNDNFEYFEDEVTRLDGDIAAAGGLVAVKHVLKTDTQATSVGSVGSTSVSGLSVSHSLADASHRLIIIVQLSGYGSQRRPFATAITADGTPIGVGGAEGNRRRVGAGNGTNDNAGTEIVSMTMVVEHDPQVTTSIDYGVEIYNLDNSTRTLYVNRTPVDSNDAQFARAASSMTLMEVKV